MQKKLISWIICVVIVCLDRPCVADKETVLRQVGENATLECPELLQGETYGSLVWSHNGKLLASQTMSGQIDIADNSMKDQVSILSDMTLVISPVSQEVKGDFECTMDFTFQGQVSSKSNGYDLVVQDVPKRPKKPKVTNVTSSQVTVTWEATDSNNSPIKNYKLDISKCNGDKPGKTTLVSNDVREHTIGNLNPYTCYTILVSAVNDIGDSIPSSREFYTEQDVISTTTTTTPTIPKVVLENVRAIPSKNEIQLLWDKPKATWNADLLGYEIEYGPSQDSMTDFHVRDPHSLETTIVGLKPYTLYKVAIRVYNSVGKGPVKAMEVQTLEGAPSKPRITHINNNKATSFCVNWEPPTVTNGKLIQYKIRWRGEDGANTSRVVGGHFSNKMSAKITDLKPYYPYVVQVAAATRYGGFGEFTAEYPALTEVMAPSAPRNLNLTKLSKTVILLKWDVPEVVYKRVDNYLIKLWNHRGGDRQKSIQGDRTEYTMKDLTPDSRYNLKVAGITKAVFSNSTLVGDFSEPIIFILGDYGNIISTVDASNKDYGNIISTVDASNKDYGNVISIVDAYNNKEPKKGGLGNGSDDGSLHPAVIVVLVGLIIVIIITIAVFVGYRSHKCRRCYQAAFVYLAVPSNGNSVPQTNITVEEPSEEKQYPDIPINDFISHVDLMHMDSDIAFAQEFDEINRASNTDKYSCENSDGSDNRMKNRYINIVAYDHSRVVLKTDMGRPKQSDYINANYVDGYKRPKAYIATQGPLPLTFPDFWRMVWEQNTSVIVMITNLMEKGRRKCDQYWPNDGQESYGNIQVKLTNTVPRAHYTVRIFTLKNLKVKKRHSMKGTSERTVYHYHYTEWPDHGVPDYSLPVLDFVQKSAAHSGPDSGPIIVHCSAGVGRTGTYILIDSMIGQIQDRRTINIPGFTQNIRRQRNYLVQTEDQYIFIHSVLVEYLLGGGTTEVKEEMMTDYLSQLEQPPNDQLLQSITKTTLLSKQFQLVTSYHPNEADQYAAHRACNVDKNREGALLPVNLKRVLLPARPGVEGSDYINASYLQGYERSGEFVVTQYPMDSTVEDFWRMVWDRNSTVIVVLCPIDDKNYKQFWPPKESSTEVDAGNFRLAMKEGPNVDEDQGFTTYEFILDSIQYDYTLMTRIICVKDWPAGCGELHRVFDVIAAAHDYITSKECGPVVVIDQFGGTAAGAFCALWTLRDQVLSEQCADFYQLAKLYHYKRPGILGTEEDFFFLHKAIAALCRHMSNTNNSSTNNSHNHHHHNHHHFSLNNHNNTNNHHNHHHNQQNGTLPRAANSSHPTNPAGLPRSSTIASGGGGGGVTGDNNNSSYNADNAPSTPTTTTTTTTNASDDSNSPNHKNNTSAPSSPVAGGLERELKELESTFLNEMNSRNSYVNADTGESKLETNI